jgi:hypothetical protein
VRETLAVPEMLILVHIGKPKILPRSRYKIVVWVITSRSCSEAKNAPMSTDASILDRIRLLLVSRFLLTPLSVHDLTLYSAGRAAAASTGPGATTLRRAVASEPCLVLIIIWTKALWFADMAGVRV